jgi:rod shape-determining protein MreC
MNFRRIRDIVIVVILLAIPFFVLRANMRDPRKLSTVDHVIMRVTAYPQYVGAMIGHGVSNFFGRYFYLVAVKERNDQLERDVVVLHERIRQLESLESDNRKLRGLLGVREQIQTSTGLDAIPAQVIGYNPTNEFRVANILLDRVNSEIKPGWPVINEEGVVGIVQRADDTHLQVQLAADPQMSIDVVDQRTGSRGFLRGTSDMRKYACQVENMRREDEVNVGDLLVTSGVGHRFPRNIPVARVTAVRNRGFGEYQEVDAEPTVRFSRVTEVLVMPPAEGRLDEVPATKH